MKPLFFTIVLVFIWLNSYAQPSRHLVTFKDKAATKFSLNNPAAYLSPRAIDRRNRYTIPVDSTDLPVPASYISSIKNIDGVEILNVSKWLNAISIKTTDANAIAAIYSLPFVESISAIAVKPANSPANKYTETISSPAITNNRVSGTTSDYYNYGTNSFNEIKLHKGEFLHNIGLRGKSLQIAMLDAGYYQYTSLKAFDSLNSNGQVLSTWDFVSGNANVAEDHQHGMQCLSTIAANIPGQFIGKAPEAGFHLFRTEDVSAEYPLEEFNWACGAERADSVGADIISSSLGYGYYFNEPFPDYPYSDLNGDKTLSARAADLAAKKGILVFNAAGNSGNDYWKMITTPADGDSVVAVGSVNAAGAVASNSSYGPSADGRIKPDMASVGWGAMIQQANNSIGSGNGTSFACPNLAGLAACLWQAFPEFNNMRIVQALKEAGNKFNGPDSRTGYGIPDLIKAFSSLLAGYATSSATINNNCTVTLTWTSKDVAGMKYIIESKISTTADFVKSGEVTATGTSILQARQYTYTTIPNNHTGPVQFRIRQVIDTSAGRYTTVLIDSSSVNLTSPCTSPLSPALVIAPNPVTSGTTLIVETAAAIPNLLISIFDMNGRLVMRMQASKAAGRKQIELPVQKMYAGKYLVKVSKDGEEIGIASFLKL